MSSKRQKPAHRVIDEDFMEVRNSFLSTIIGNFS